MEGLVGEAGSLRKRRIIGASAGLAFPPEIHFMPDGRHKSSIITLIFYDSGCTNLQAEDQCLKVLLNCYVLPSVE